MFGQQLLSGFIQAEVGHGKTCPAGRRRRRSVRAITEGTSDVNDENDDVDYQTNGVPKPVIISPELFVTDHTDDESDGRAKKVINRIAGGLASMQRNFETTRRAVTFLEKFINGVV